MVARRALRRCEACGQRGGVGRPNRYALPSWERRVERHREQEARGDEGVERAEQGDHRADARDRGEHGHRELIVSGVTLHNIVDGFAQETPFAISDVVSVDLKLQQATPVGYEEACCPASTTFPH